MNLSKNAISILLEFKKETKLHMIRVRFGTFSFDRVTKLLKANLVDKLSHFGGTAGLFTGFSFISAFEFIPFVMTLLIMLCQFLTSKKGKLRSIQVQKFETKENENPNEDIDLKLNHIAQKIAPLEREVNVYRQKMVNDLQTLEALEKEVKDKVDVNGMEKKIQEKIDQQYIGNFLDNFGLNP